MRDEVYPRCGGCSLSSWDVVQTSGERHFSEKPECHCDLGWEPSPTTVCSGAQEPQPSVFLQPGVPRMVRCPFPCSRWPSGEATPQAVTSCTSCGPVCCCLAVAFRVCRGNFSSSHPQKESSENSAIDEIASVSPRRFQECDHLRLALMPAQAPSFPGSQGCLADWRHLLELGVQRSEV